MSRQSQIAVAVSIMMTTVITLTAATTAGKFQGQWKTGKDYNKDDTVFTIAADGEALKKGDTLYWKASWALSTDVPGEFLDSGGTSGWKYQNSLTAKPGSKPFVFTGAKEAASLAAGKAIIPTWRNGALGAYSITHDDYSGMDWETQVKDGYELELKYGIKTVYGAVVDKMERELPHLQDMINNGYEVMSHSWNHHSAADQWQEFYHGDTIPYGLPEDVPEEITAKLEAEGKKISTDPAIHEAEVYWSAKLGKPMKFGGKVVDTTKYDDKDFIIDDAKGTIAGNTKVWIDENPTQNKGFILFCVNGWYGQNPSDQDSNVVLSKAGLDNNIWNTLLKEGNQWFRAGRKTEFFIYPYDAYSEKTHAALYKAGYISARGGAKSGAPIPGDFVHPYRIDFDAFYSVDGTVGDGSDHSKNPHQKLGLKEMCENIIKTHGYMIRETHAIVPEFEDYWGGIKTSEWEKHMVYLKEKQDKNELWIGTCAEVVKYRMTANKVTVPTVTGTGGKMTLKVTLNPTFDTRYADEITVLVKLPAGADESKAFGVQYVGGTAKAPRNMPKKISDGLYAVYIDPVIGTTVEFGTGVDIVSMATEPAASTLKYAAQITGCTNQELSLSIPKGDFTAQVLGMNGRLIRSVHLTGETANASVQVPLSGMGSGTYIINLKSAAGVSMLHKSFMVK